MFIDSRQIHEKIDLNAQLHKHNVVGFHEKFLGVSGASLFSFLLLEISATFFCFTTKGWVVS